MYVHQLNTVTPKAQEGSGNGHCGQLCNTNTDMTSKVLVLHHKEPCSYCKNDALSELLTMWLDTMVPTLNNLI